MQTTESATESIEAPNVYIDQLSNYEGQTVTVRGWLVHHRGETQRLRNVGDRELAHFLTPTLDPKVASLPRGVGFLNRLLRPYWSLARRAL